MYDLREALFYDQVISVMSRGYLLEIFDIQDVASMLVVYVVRRTPLEDNHGLSLQSLCVFLNQNNELILPNQPLLINELRLVKKRLAECVIQNTTTVIKITSIYRKQLQSIYTFKLKQMFFQCHKALLSMKSYFICMSCKLQLAYNFH